MRWEAWARALGLGSQGRRLHLTLKETQGHLPTCENEDRMQDQHLRSLQSHDGRRGLHRLPGTLTHFSNT